MLGLIKSLFGAGGASVSAATAHELQRGGVPLTGEGPVLFICRSGMRSGAACGALRSALGERAVNVEGGMMAWAAAGLPVEAGR